ncbi:MAG: DEAD/DEAH box helicase family protein [Rhodospirillales bacterium]|nr:DEAD/DEAH box helicase family protein [Rhodospirillales bacterium]
MKLKFKKQPYQTDAVEAVAECLAGQPFGAGMKYRVDPGRVAVGGQYGAELADGFRNPDIVLPPTRLLDNIHAVQRRQNLPLSASLVTSRACPLNLDIEMETGTGKTYCYIKTMFELNRQYGFSKFIVVVPSIAIREGVHKSFEITAEHFLGEYGKRARFFIYSSRELHNLESFSTDAGLNVMIINVQAFNATGKDARRIYEELDDFQTRKPIDVIAANRPILILDEPQKMEGAKTLEGLAKFRPSLMLRYSATHKTEHNKIYRLDAIDAYNQRLVKKIAVRGITVRGLSGTNAYLYLESIEVSKSKPPVARVEMEIRTQSGIKREMRKLTVRDNLLDRSNGLEQYDGFVVSEVDAVRNTVSFLNGVEIEGGQAIGDVNESSLRRIQIREAIKAHFEKERSLFDQGIKVLSLFFIDEVAKYRDYAMADEKGEYARAFEEEYEAIRAEVLAELPLDDNAWRSHLERIDVGRTHNGYFSIDKKGKLTDPAVKARGEDAGLSDDVDAYDLILKDKERLLSFEEPVRFIFSHSALREGWDNPNVFVICALKHSDNTISRRQEVGRGLRLSVNQDGDRMDNPVTVHHVNVLTVVASESYKDFVGALQADIGTTLSARPRLADEAYFTGKVLKTEHGDVAVTAQVAKLIHRYLIKNDYTDEGDRITQAYHDAVKEGTLAALPPELAPHATAVHQLVGTVFSDALLPQIDDDRKAKPNPLNANFHKKEFQELWGRINRKAIYAVQFETTELVGKCIRALDSELKVSPLQYHIVAGEQEDQATYDSIRNGEAFRVRETTTQTHNASVHSAVTYDLVGKLAEATTLTRATIADVLQGISSVVFAQYRTNPEDFIQQAGRLINEQKATVIVEHLTYDPTGDTYSTDIFTQDKNRDDFAKAIKTDRHVFDYVFTDSKIERDFVSELDTSQEVVVYAKLPRGFFIPTPVGDYNPDWAIAFRQGAVKHIYFVAETKGSMSSMELKLIENSKIACARKFFAKITSDQVKYDVVSSFGKLMEVVQG